MVLVYNDIYVVACFFYRDRIEPICFFVFSKKKGVKVFDHPNEELIPDVFYEGRDGSLPFAPDQIINRSSCAMAGGWFQDGNRWWMSENEQEQNEPKQNDKNPNDKKPNDNANNNDHNNNNNNNNKKDNNIVNGNKKIKNINNCQACCFPEAEEHAFYKPISHCHAREPPPTKKKTTISPGTRNNSSGDNSNAGGDTEVLSGDNSFYPAIWSETPLEIRRDVLAVLPTADDFYTALKRYRL